MNFDWPKGYSEFRDEVVEFAKDELCVTDMVGRDYGETFAQDLWEKCAEFGIQGLAASKEYGGKFDEIDILRAVYAIEGLGYGCSDTGLVLGLNAQMWAVQISIELFGTPDQKERFLKPMAAGTNIGCHALTEAASGSDVFDIGTTAEPSEGGYVLNGEKRLVTLAPVANTALVFANVRPESGKWGITAFLVETDSKGCAVSETHSKMGLRTVPIGEITFDNCFVPMENRLGKEGAGFSISNHSLEFDRCCILAGKLGTMQRQLEENIDFARSRIRFGKKIGEFQSVSNRIADMKLRIETSKLLLYKMAWLKKNDKPAMMEAAMLKLHLSEAFVESSLDSIRNHGGDGYLTAFEIERDLRDSVGGLLYAGTSDIQRNIISKLLGL